MASSGTLQATFIFLAAAAAISSLQSENSENSFPAAAAAASAAAADITDADRQLGRNAVATYNGQGSGIPLTFCNVIDKIVKGDFLTLRILVHEGNAPSNQEREALAAYDVQNIKAPSYIDLTLGSNYNGATVTCITAA
ncbi:hypothetical protein AXF42_Ash018382 [Apostasia shenzhenica]|uniref:Uncharacterized protein n=1 Tax=Apostasia shenzhenica TaxID=1088818 RepID=A0A2I0BE64_9ASPA|nr:hypothetical protein AXF42_Ash018382 [Apostasia shenzhenica]